MIIMGRKEEVTVVRFSGVSKIINNICLTWCCLLLMQASAASGSNKRVNVVSHGAKPDGQTDSTKAFVKAWVRACGSGGTMYAPKGRFLIKAAEFRGPCRNRVTVEIDGTLVAPTDYWAMGNSGFWIRSTGLPFIGAPSMPGVPCLLGPQEIWKVLSRRS